MSRSRPLDLSGAPNRADLLREARRLGCAVHALNRTGEVSIQPPDGGPIVVINNRRKQGTIALLMLLRRVRGER